MQKLLISGLTALSLVLTPTLTYAHGHDNDDHRGGNHYSRGNVIVVNNHDHRPSPKVYNYHGNALADLATFAVFAGITYAIVGNNYYRQNGDQYVYVQNPPAGNYTVVSAPNTVASDTSLTPGTVVDVVAGVTKKVAYDGRLYYVANGVWYLALEGGKQFVVVKAPN
ncbi:hypothetical protein PY479_09985 [Shewanella sp. A32]|uniref:hypothetical protein n=1 Tax=Shewanella sp. A32 TaxID=3031327 RepID=UPI0023B8D19B|nr:hypothetical protein [Shewanella sp. A32]MDF0534600.1 hypothetical protein [Shewanella sp. A32]